MAQFNCLSRDCPVFGPHLLEASAGTGKTFSIEQIYVRLILESQGQVPIDVEQILAVTFTRAAARELKTRIRANFEKALSFFESGKKDAAWDYLKPYFESKDDLDEAKRVLSDALVAFDRCQIFTIHGFCWRMLREFAFEANENFSLADPDQETGFSPNLSRAVLDFLELGIDEKILCPEQAGLLLRKFPSLEEMGERLLRFEEAEGFSFLELHSRCKAALQACPFREIDPKKLFEDFHSLRPHFKAVVKGDFEAQTAAFAEILADPENPSPLRLLIKEKANLFSFLDLQNRKVRTVLPEFFHYPGIFEWGGRHLMPLIQKANRDSFLTLQAAWNPLGKKIALEEESLSPDEILSKMKKAVEQEPFIRAIQSKYAAAIIDEFQDTDETQWEIFQRLFLHQTALRAIYLVGDPKQSIYRFRKADVYIYLKAKEVLGEKALYHLDTNFRSSKKLVSALNALFSREWLYLPQAKQPLEYLPVKAGAQVDSDFADQKGALHVLLAEGDPKALFESVFLPYAALEIEKLLPEVKKANSLALLVKDRFQAEQALEFLKQRGIGAVARSRTPLGTTFAFEALSELFDAILSPEDENRMRIVQAGPFSSLKNPLPLARFKRALEERGLVFFCSLFFNTRIDGRSIKERIVSYDLSFYRDLMQIFEILFAWESNQGFSFESFKKFLARLKNLKEDQGGRRRMETDEDAVQVMTLHVSKGLEFDVVFALGLISPTPDTEEEVEELNAEKLRQLYVAMTRAKKRLYVPALLAETKGGLSTRSPMELFCAQLEKESPLPDFLEALGKEESITFERLPDPLPVPPSSFLNKALPSLSFIEPKTGYSASLISSFTSLAKTKGEILELPPLGMTGTDFTLHTMPRGAETGILIHSLFEKLFCSSKWKNPEEIERLVEEELRFSPLFNWKKPIQQGVLETLAMPLHTGLETFSLNEVDPTLLQVEMEFLFDTPPNFVKGFIDLVFFHKGKYYFVDWKTNWLGNSDEDYDFPSLSKAMENHDYPLQAAIYAEALRRHLKMEGNFDEVFGGAFYLFLRGKTYFHLQPDLKIYRESHVPF
jgi:exodeoxyribonuclease V beta subunit